MNYNFYLLKIGQLSASDHKAVLDYVESVPLDLATTDWDMTRHKGVIGRQFTREETPAMVNALMCHEAFNWFARGSLKGHEIVKLPPGSFLREHTDSYTTKQNCSLTHRVHIPLTGNANYWFRRDEGIEPVAERMELGSIYLFNNYVLHSVKPIGLDTRTNLMLEFSDNSLEAKARIYDKFNITWRF